jgi:archaetidylinositol phosphate synthase
MLGSIRPLLKPLVLSIAKPLARAGVPPNLFSVTAVPLAAAAAWAIVTAHWPLAFLFTALSGLVDLLDGSVARLQDRESPFGNYLDTMLDRIVEVVLYLGLVLVWPIPAATALAFSMLVSYAKARVALVIPTDDRDWPGMGDRADRIAMLLIGLIAASVGFPLVLRAVVWLIAATTVIGTAQRMVYAHKLILEVFPRVPRPVPARRDIAS